MPEEKEVETIEIELFWDAPDKEYGVRLKQQPGVSTFGKTIPKALKEFGKVLPMVIELEGFKTLVEGTDKKLIA